MNKKYKKLSYAAIAIIITLFTYRVWQAKFKTSEISLAPLKISVFDLAEKNQDNAFVYATGKVESLEQVDIKAEMSAKVKKVNFKLGDEVSKGDVIMELDNAILGAQLSQAQAALNQRLAGASTEDIKIYEGSVELAKADLEKTKSDVQSAVNAYESALQLAENNLMTSTGNPNGAIYDNNNIVNNVYENLANVLKSISLPIESGVDNADKVLGFNNESSNNDYKTVLGAKDSSTLSNAKSSFLPAESGKDVFLNKKSSIDTMTKDELKEFAIESRETLRKINNLLNNISALLDATISHAGYSEAQLSSLKSLISAERTKINGAESTLTAAIQSLDSSQKNLNSYQIAYEKAQRDLLDAKKSAENTIHIKETAYKQAQANLSKVQADPRDVDLASLRAIVAQSAAAFSKSVISAPFDGTISSMPFKEGDLVSAGKIISGVVNDKGLQVKIYINPEERMKIKESSKVIIEDQYEGLVVSIAPSVDTESRKIEVVVAISDDNIDKLTIGQYANLKIEIEKNENDNFLIPLSSVRTKNDKSFVLIASNENILKEQEVSVGEIIGDNVEILSGLSGEEKIAASASNLKDGQKIEIR